MRYQTEAEAFRAIAEKFARGSQTYPMYGICAEIRLIERSYDAPYHVINAMYAQTRHHAGSFSGYAYGTDYTTTTPCGYAAIRDDEGRALACLWMALEAEEEGK